MSYSVYNLAKKQVSNDSGVTWVDVEPLETQISGEPIATYDTYEECIRSIGHFKLKYRTSDARDSEWECEESTTINRVDVRGLKDTMTSAIIGDCVTIINNQAFSGFTKLSSVTISYGVLNINYSAFNGCSGLTSVTIPNSVTYIGDDAFYGCNSLPSVTIPNSVTSIGQTAFYNCTSLSSVTIPDSVRSIGTRAFNRCTSLQSVTVLATTPPSLGGSDYNYVFDNTNNCPIYVPSGSLNAYKTATNWSDYADRIQAIP